MVAGRRGRGAPYPHHLSLGGVGLMLSVQKDGTLDWKEATKPMPGPEGEGQQRVTALRTDFTGGFGQRKDDGTPEAHKAIFFSRLPAGIHERDGRDRVGGGLDPRWGGLMGAPRIGMTAAGAEMSTLAGFGGADTTIRKLASFTVGATTYHLAACGRNLIATTDPVTWTAPTATVKKTFTVDEGNIIDLKVYGSRKGGAELEIALASGPRYITYDLTTFTADGQSSSDVTVTRRKVVPQAFYIWDASDGQFYDLTATVTDDNPATGTGDYLKSLTNTDYVLVGFRHLFEAIDFLMGPHKQGNDAVAAVYYWKGSWAAVAGLADTTFASTASLKMNGTMSWTAPTDWLPTVLTNQYESEPLYFVKIAWDKAIPAAPGTVIFDGNIQVADVKIQYRLSPQAYAVSGTSLVMVVDNAALVSTPSGGTDGIVYDTTGPFAIPAVGGGAFAGGSGSVVGAANLAGTVYVVKTNGVFSISQTGVPSEIAPHMADQPSVEAHQAAVVWNNKLYASHDWELLAVTPDGGVEASGPERMTFGSATGQYRATALEGHGLHFLYAAFKGTDGKAYLGAYGVYRHVTPYLSQIAQWIRMDEWSIIADLAPIGTGSGRTITSMKVMFRAHGSAEPDQPYLVMGDDLGNVCWAWLPKGFHPLDAGSGYQWSDCRGEAVLPEYDGFDPTREVFSARATFRVRGADGTHFVRLATKGGTADTASNWTERCQSADVDGDGFDDLALSPPHDAYGLNVRLTLDRPAGYHGQGVILDGFSPWFRQELLGGQRSWTFNVQAHDRVRNLQGKRLPRTTGQWASLVRAWSSPPDGTSHAKRFALVAPNGETLQVAVDAVALTLGRPQPQGPPMQAFSLTVSSAE